MVKDELTIYEQLRAERVELVKTGECPDWYITAGYQMVKSRYLLDGETPRGMYRRIARTAAKHLPNVPDAEEKFFDLMWKGWLSPSTPVLTNMGTNKGCPVSCSGSYVDDSVYGFYSTQLETAVLTKNGFGTSGYLGDIRPRGSSIASGNQASGVMPVIKDFVQLAKDINQGGRRGAWAGYLPIDHGDFYEVISHLNAEPAGLNIGWIISDDFIARLESGDDEANARWQKVIKTRMILGKGYLVKIDHANRANPPMYEDHDLSVKASQLCTEIFLHSDNESTYTCVLSSMNLSKYDDWKETEAVFWSTVFLDCVASEFIEIGSKIPGMEKAVKFTEEHRALGLGVLGFHTYIQSNGIAFADAGSINKEIFVHLQECSDQASCWMALHLGEPKYCKGYDRRNSHTLAVAPTMSTALICGGVSQGIEPVIEVVFTQASASGEVERVNPVFLRLAQYRGNWGRSLINDIIKNNGSVQHLDWLTDAEKEVFKTAFEIDQHQIVRLASERQPYIDQGQSVNLFFSSEAGEGYVAAVHKHAMQDDNIKSLYYCRSKSGVRGATESECSSCEG